MPPDSIGNATPPVAVSVWGPLLGAAAIILAGLLVYRGNRTRELATRWYASAYAGAIFALLALFAGSVAEFKNQEILRAWPLRYTDDSPVSAPVVFWVSVILLFAIGIAYYAATDRLRSAEIEGARTATLESRKHTAALIERLRTLPPEGFMRDFPGLSSGMLAPFSRALITRRPEDIEVAIRYALRAAALKAARFGRSPSGARYNANAMRFHASDQLGPMGGWTADQLRLYPEGFRPDAIEGALCFVPEQSSSSVSENADPVPGLRDLRIVIPRPSRDRPRGAAAEGDLRCLPGCATAFVTRKPFIADDAWDMRNSLVGHFVPEEVVAASDTYLRDGSADAMRSFVALPVFELHPDGEAVGVLNVELTRTNIFGGHADTVEQFALAVAPVCFVIATLWQLQDDTGTAPL